MVVFKDDPEKYNSPNMYLKIQEQMNNVIELNKKISTMEEGSFDAFDVQRRLISQNRSYPLPFQKSC